VVSHCEKEVSFDQGPGLENAYSIAQVMELVADPFYLEIPQLPVLGKGALYLVCSASYPKTTTKRRIPASCAVMIVRLSKGIPITSKSGLGKVSPSARMRFPFPAANCYQVTGTACTLK